ncbi:MAG: hypothetical protein VYC42_16665 [Pseudomonadota bacterium]|nr:hypothetical protein [Nevskiales bacterium]MEC9364853.1 hypothetical protein [Pseudomonadota bacterium]
MKVPALAALCLGLSATALPARAQSGEHYLELSAAYKGGDFGTDTDSRLYALLPAWGYIAPRYDLGVTVPVLRLSEDGPGSSTTETGLGDVILRGGHALWDGSGGARLYGSVALKLPTADDGAGLGTGATDVGAFLSWRTGSVRPLNLYGGYIVTGEHGSDDLRNVALGGVAVSGRFGRSYGYAGVEARSAAVRGGDAAVEPQFGLLRPLGRNLLFKGTAFVGLTDGGPDYGVSLGLARWIGNRSAMHAAAPEPSTVLARAWERP